MKTRRSGRNGPIVLTGKPKARRPARGREDVLGAGALEAPLPGRLLVLLSRLHRAETARPDEDEAGRLGTAPPLRRM
ncbi:hypothetical protein [Methylobacterium nigriterrae]|uniref:hypothetical protein n=1 Tax=Methylobacterium nigriterrae TaxID=3127512 RepID=UPI003013CBB8